MKPSVWCNRVIIGSAMRDVGTIGFCIIFFLVMVAAIVTALAISPKAREIWREL